MQNDNLDNYRRAIKELDAAYERQLEEIRKSERRVFLSIIILMAIVGVVAFII